MKIRGKTPYTQDIGEKKDFFDAGVKRGLKPGAVIVEAAMSEEDAVKPEKWGVIVRLDENYFNYQGENRPFVCRNFTFVGETHFAAEDLLIVHWAMDTHGLKLYLENQRKANVLL